MPWNSPNFEHLEVRFTQSLQTVEWRKLDDIQTVVGTICVFEEDWSIQAYPGHYDCFTERFNLIEKMDANLDNVDYTYYTYTPSSVKVTAPFCPILKAHGFAPSGIRPSMETESWMVMFSHCTVSLGLMKRIF